MERALFKHCSISLNLHNIFLVKYLWSSVSICVNYICRCHPVLARECVCVCVCVCARDRAAIKAILLVKCRTTFSDYSEYQSGFVLVCVSSSCHHQIHSFTCACIGTVACSSDFSELRNLYWRQVTDQGEWLHVKHYGNWKLTTIEMKRNPQQANPKMKWRTSKRFMISRSIRILQMK